MKPLMKYHIDLETTTKHKVATWGVLPVTSDTKIIDGIYNPETKNLTLLLDSVTDQYQEIPVKGANGKFEAQLRKVPQYYKIQISENDIPAFLENYVENNFEIEATITPSIITNE